MLIPTPTEQALPTSPLVERIRRGVIGADAVLEGPYGPRRITYADYTASGRAVDLIEDVIRTRVLPLYGNTHTESSGTGRHTTALREQARRIIRDAVGGGEDDLVIFCGSGATGAVDRLVTMLNLRLPADLDARYRLSDRIPPAERPVVFVGPYEHHSNELPWRESIADTVRIPADGRGRIDLAALEAQLRRYADRPLRIGSFSAASNVTGIVSDTRAVSRLLHEHGALSFWDCATAAPYLPVEMAGSAAGAGDHKDAVFLSPHKFLGGPGTPGVLVVRRGLARNRVPSVPGGGTIAYVSPVEYAYIADPVAREEGGTPAIVESIRAGLVLRLTRAVGLGLIGAREAWLARRALSSWRPNPRLELLGNVDCDRLPIISLRVRRGDRWLHHELVVALLSDLFGIQARGGCSCAGPYGHELLRIDADRAHALLAGTVRGWSGIKPGWTRVTLHWVMSPAECDYLIQAVHLVADHGWRLLDDYRFDPGTGRWRHRAEPPDAPFRLTDLSLDSDHAATPRALPESALARHLADARRVLAACRVPARRGERPTGLPADIERLRWFELSDRHLG